MNRILFCLALFVLVAFAQLNYETGITGPGKTNGWDGDLGVPFLFNNLMYFLEGDILHQNYGRIPNAIGYCTNIANCEVVWNEVNGGWPYPFYYLLGQSTVPSGAITINGEAYIFMMNVINWGSSSQPFVATALGIKGIPPTPFAATSVKFGDNSKFTNIAPVLDVDNSTVYLYGAGLYRAAPISLAKVPASQLGDMNAFLYFSHLGPNGPVWSPNYNDANTIITGRVGELGAMYNTYAKQWFVSYFDFDTNGASVLRLARSKTPWGPFDTSTILFDSQTHYAWMQNGWGGPYGGYVVPDNGSNSPILYICLSLWVPYRVFIMSVDLSQEIPTVIEVQPLNKSA